jgi:Arylsulfotransferase (ASST)
MKPTLQLATLFVLASSAFAQSVPVPPPDAHAAPDAKAAAPADAPPPGPPPWSASEAAEPRGLRVHEPGAQPGWTLVAPLNSKSIHLIDLDGKVVHTWETGYVPGGSTALLPNGDLLRCAQEPDNPRFHGGGIGGRIEELDWDGKVVWSWKLCGPDLTQHHEALPLPNGHVMLIAWEYHSREELIAHGRVPEECGEEGLWTDVLLEVKPVLPDGGEIVWKWRVWDHLVQDFDARKPDYGKPAAEPGRFDLNGDVKAKPKEPKESEEEARRREEQEAAMRAIGYAGGKEPKPSDSKEKKLEPDWMHVNGVSYDAARDLLVVSSPHACEIWVLDHSTTTAEAATASGGRRGHGGEMLWRWGNPRNYGAGGEADQRLFYQHNPTWLPGPTPRLLVFDNGQNRPGDDFSEVLELTLPFDETRGFTRGPGQAFGPAEPSWRYADPADFYSGFISGAQRLPNGDTLICSGAPGRVFEVTPDGRIVWDWRSTLGGEVEPTKQGGKAPPKALFRAWRVPADDAVLSAKLRR